MIEEANIHFHYTPGNEEKDTVQTRIRRRRFLSNILTQILGNIDWKVNFSTIIPFNEDEHLDRPKRYFTLHKKLGDRNLTYSEYSGHDKMLNGTHDFTFKCHRCHGRSRISYILYVLLSLIIDMSCIRIIDFNM